MQNAGLNESQAAIKIARRNINNLRYSEDITLMEESEEELNNILMRVREENEKAGLKLSIQKVKIRASSSITSRQIEGKKVETVTHFIFLGSKITADGDCSHEIKRHLLLERKTMTNLDSIFIKKQRHHFANKGLYSQSYDFSSSHVGMWDLNHKEGWVLENWCFSVVVLEKTPESPLDCKEIKPVNSKGHQPWIFTERIDAEVEAPILWPPNVRRQLIGKDPEAGKDWRQEETGSDKAWDGWMASPTQWRWVWASSGKYWRTEKPGVLQSMESQRVGYNLVTKQQ